MAIATQQQTHVMRTGERGWTSNTIVVDQSSDGNICTSESYEGSLPENGRKRGGNDDRGRWAIMTHTLPLTPRGDKRRSVSNDGDEKKKSKEGGDWSVRWRGGEGGLYDYTAMCP